MSYLFICLWQGQWELFAPCRHHFAVYAVDIESEAADTFP